MSAAFSRRQRRVQFININSCKCRLLFLILAAAPQSKFSGGEREVVQGFPITVENVPVAPLHFLKHPFHALETALVLVKFKPIKPEFERRSLGRCPLC